VGAPSSVTRHAAGPRPGLEIHNRYSLRESEAAMSWQIGLVIVVALVVVLFLVRRRRA
jgi:hypothetical protein